MPHHSSARIVFTLIFLLCSYSVWGSGLPLYQLMPLTVDSNDGQFLELRPLIPSSKNKTASPKSEMDDSHWSLDNIQKIRVSANGYSRNMSPGSPGFPAEKSRNKDHTGELFIPAFHSPNQVISIEWLRTDDQQQMQYVSTLWLTRSTHSDTPASAATASIRPLLDPTILKSGSDLAVRLYVRGTPMKHTELFAQHVKTGKTERAISDDQGIATIRLTDNGDWRLMFQQQFGPNDPDPGLYSAVLHFSNQQEPE